MRSLAKINITTIISLLLGFVFVLLNFLYFIPVAYIGLDTMAWILGGVGPRLGLGVPYKNFWDIMPPGLSLLTFLWSIFFGYSDLSFLVFHLITLLCLAILFSIIFKKLRMSFVILPAIVSSYILTFSPTQMMYLLTSEQLGLLFACLGLISIIYSEKNSFYIFLGSFFIFLSSQMRDPYGLTIICVLPVIINNLVKKKSLIKPIFLIIAGVLTGIIIIALYLLMMGNLIDYLEILSFKGLTFKIFDLNRIKDNFVELIPFIFGRFYQFNVLICPIILFGIVSNVIYCLLFRKQSFLSKNVSLWIIFFFCIGSLIGSSLYGTLGTHRLIQVAFTMTAFLSLSISLYKEPLRYFFYKITFSSKYSIILSSVICFSLCLIITFPKVNYFYSYGLSFVSEKLGNFHLVTPATYGVIDFIKENTTENDCILHYYGWEVDSTYFYSRRRPCTKFVKPNLFSSYYIGIYPKYFSQLVAGLKNNPPKLIYYTTNLPDMDIDWFESNVIPVGAIIKNCYQKTNHRLVFVIGDVKNEEFLKCYQSFFR